VFLALLAPASARAQRVVEGGPPAIEAVPEEEPAEPAAPVAPAQPAEPAAPGAAPAEPAAPAAPPPSSAAEPTPSSPPLLPGDPVELTIRGERRPPPVAASDLRVKVGQLREVPRRSAEELLTLAPGMLLTKRGGEGQASGIFLRGFDAREGQDLELQVAGVPLNEVANPHGHGYADTHFLIPELVSELRVVEGPFDPRQGDFAVAGSARYELALPERGVLVKGGFGSFDTRRALLLWGPEHLSQRTFAGVDLVDGSGFGPNRAHTSARLLAQHEWTAGQATRIALLATGYVARWDSAGVLRADDLRAGRLPCATDQRSQFLCTYDPNQGGASSRHGISARLLHLSDAGQWEALAFATLRHLRLRENYTGFAFDERLDGGSRRGDGVEQIYGVTTVGTRGAYRAAMEPGGAFKDAELGYYLRHDTGDSRQRRLRRQDGVPYRVDLESGLRVTNLGLHAGARVEPVRRLSLSGGVRVDSYVFAVVDRNRPASDRTGARETSDHGEAFGYAIQPKLSVDVFIGRGVHAVASGGVGTRSSDAQALSDGEFAPFARVRAAELGLVWTGRPRGAAVDARLVSFATRVDRDMLFDQNVGRNVLSGASYRYGAMASGRVTGARTDALASATFAEAHLQEPGAAWYDVASGPRMPYIPRWVFRGDVSRHQPLPFAYRGMATRVSLAAGGSYVAPRPLPFEQLAPVVLSLDLALRIAAGSLEVGVEATNVLDRRNHASEFNYVSNFRGATEPASLLPQQHFVAGAPRALMMTFAYRHTRKVRLPGEAADATP
jgi:hypothetical protein